MLCVLAAASATSHRTSVQMRTQTSIDDVRLAIADTKRAASQNKPLSESELDD